MRWGYVLSVLAGLTAAAEPPQRPVLRAPRDERPVRVDGRLDDACWQRAADVRTFVVAGQSDAHPQPTEAWVSWNEHELRVAFRVVDRDIVALPPAANEREVDQQDRVEVFLWNGHATRAYGCLELAPAGALHDYEAKFYRQFRTEWKAQGLQTAAHRTDDGYTSELVIPADVVESLGLSLTAEARWRCGLFRANFSQAALESPEWLCWFDPQNPEPDFHVAESFGELELCR